MSNNMSATSLCRCCHTESTYKSLGATFVHNGKEETYSVLLQETFNIVLAQSEDGATFSICESCEPRVVDAAQFKHQMLDCEQKLRAFLDGDHFGKLKAETDTIFENESEPVQIYISAVDNDDQPLSMLRSAGDENRSDDGDGWNQHDSDDNYTKPHTTKSKKFSCSYCEKKFTYNGSLEMHLKIHTGEKTYPCLLCKVSSTNNYELTKHYQDFHSVGDMFPCTICTKPFDKARLLKNI